MFFKRRSPKPDLLTPVAEGAETAETPAAVQETDDIPKSLRESSGSALPPPGPKPPRRSIWPWRRGPRPRRSWRYRFGMFVLRWTAISGTAAAAILAALVTGYSYFADDPLKAGLSKAPAKLTILASSGKVIAEKGVRRNHVPLAAMPPHLVKAVLATEDRRFYGHFGVDPRGVLRAILANRRAGTVVQGGSTITQQLAKVLFLKPDRTYWRKAEELLLALSLEYRLEKDQILELYLNRIYFGAGNYGVEAAAQYYFGKSIGRISLYEAAILAGLIKAPNRYAPTTNLQRSLDRGKVVLQSMLSTGAITRAEYEEALADPPSLRTFLPSESYGYIIDWVAQILAEEGLNSQEDMVVETTIDYELQGVAQGVVRDNMAQHGAKFKAGQAAAIILDTTGAVRALVGGREYAKNQFNRAVQAKRQPGSTFKPFVWLTALENGLTPDSIVHDGPIRVGDWTPANYNERYYGDVTLQNALAHSLNTVSVRLTEWAGRDEVIRTAHRLGISSPLQNIPSIALGTSEVSLLEMTSAYVPFANGGFSAKPHIIKAVRDAEGQYVFKQGRTNWGRVIRSEHVADMNAMLTATIETGTGHKASLAPHPAAGKTGTTQSYRDAWFIGYSAYYVTGVWIGNDNSAPMKRVTGGSLPTMIWRDLMLYAHVSKQPALLPGGDRRQQQASGWDPFDAIGRDGDGGGGRSLWDSLFGGSETRNDPTLGMPPATREERDSRRRRRSWLEDFFD